MSPYCSTKWHVCKKVIIISHYCLFIPVRVQKCFNATSTCVCCPTIFYYLTSKHGWRCPGPIWNKRYHLSMDKIWLFPKFRSYMDGSFKLHTRKAKYENGLPGSIFFLNSKYLCFLMKNTIYIKKVLLFADEMSLLLFLISFRRWRIMIVNSRKNRTFSSYLWAMFLKNNVLSWICMEIIMRPANCEKLKLVH